MRWKLPGQVAQLVEQRTENPCVGGSIPPLATRFKRPNGSVPFGRFCVQRMCVRPACVFAAPFQTTQAHRLPRPCRCERLPARSPVPAAPPLPSGASTSIDNPPGLPPANPGAATPHAPLLSLLPFRFSPLPPLFLPCSCPVSGLHRPLHVTRFWPALPPFSRHLFLAIFCATPPFRGPQ